MQSSLQSKNTKVKGIKGTNVEKKDVLCIYMQTVCVYIDNSRISNTQTLKVILIFNMVAKHKSIIKKISAVDPWTTWTA